MRRSNGLVYSLKYYNFIVWVILNNMTKLNYYDHQLLSENVAHEIKINSNLYANKLIFKHDPQTR